MVHTNKHISDIEKSRNFIVKSAGLEFDGNMTLLLCLNDVEQC